MLRNNSGDFYPRSPCGERPTRTPDLTTIGQFLSTLSLRRATGRWLLPERGHRISIHALLAESDGESNCAYLPGCISIHALLAESDDTWQRGSRVTYVISIHALLAESDRLAPRS